MREAFTRLPDRSRSEVATTSAPAQTPQAACAKRFIAANFSLPGKSNDQDYAFTVSASEIIKELPKLSEADRRAIRNGLLEIANQDSDVAMCNQAALDGVLMLDHMENECT